MTMNSRTLLKSRASVDIIMKTVLLITRVGPFPIYPTGPRQAPSRSQRLLGLVQAYNPPDYRPKLSFGNPRGSPQAAQQVKRPLRAQSHVPYDDVPRPTLPEHQVSKIRLQAQELVEVALAQAYSKRACYPHDDCLQTPPPQQGMDPSEGCHVDNQSM